jgi:hypothetical protein
MHFLVFALFSRGFVQVSSERQPGGEEMSEGWLRNDGLAQGTDQLAQQSPQSGPGQAAQAQCGESSSASTDGSSNSSASNWARI